MVSVVLGAAALSTALVGGYGLYKYLTKTSKSAEITSGAPPPSSGATPPSGVAPPPVPPKPSHKLRRGPLVTLDDEPASFDQVRIREPPFICPPDTPLYLPPLQPPRPPALSSPSRNKGPINRRPPSRQHL